jgi:hypothetical protein
MPLYFLIRQILEARTEILKIFSFVFSFRDFLTFRGWATWIPLTPGIGILGSRCDYPQMFWRSFRLLRRIFSDVFSQNFVN